jgi:hypothetical protein
MDPNLIALVTQNVTLHFDTKDSPRRRTLSQWSLLPKKAYTDPNLKIWCLTGWVEEEADGSRPPARWTVTGPIVSYEDGIVTTASGSKYKLLTQSSKADPFVELNSDNSVFPEEYLNKWINGDNWVTI